MSAYHSVFVGGVPIAGASVLTALIVCSGLHCVTEAPATSDQHDSDSSDVGSIDSPTETDSGGGPKVCSSSEFVDFGGQPVGQPIQKEVLLAACGGMPVLLTSIQVVGAAGSAFLLVTDEFPNGKLPSADDASSAVEVMPGHQLSLTIQYTPLDIHEFDVESGMVRPDEDFILVQAAGQTMPVRIGLLGTGTSVLCPQPRVQILEGISVPALTTVHLESSSSAPSTGAISSYAWSVLQPTQNLFLLAPSDNLPAPTHQTTVIGSYRYCLDICDNNHCSADSDCQTTRCIWVDAVSLSGIHCELSWITPLDADKYDDGFGKGADVDLHVLLHPPTDLLAGWFDPNSDLHRGNSEVSVISPETGIELAGLFVRSDEDGWGPEVAIVQPVSGRIRLGVYYPEDHGFGASSPMLQCYSGGGMLLSVGGPGEPANLHEHDLWVAAEIDWPSGASHKLLDADGAWIVLHDVAW